MIKHFLMMFCMAVMLTACSIHSPFTIKDSAPKDSSFDIHAIPDAVPRRELVTKAGNTSPYTVLGKTYHLLPSSHGYLETGVASWYGSKFHGRPTANGERYDVYGMTAAHKTLPIPSYLQVTNLDNGRKIIVRVNDRGPFHDERIIDLSYAAAVRLGYAEQGTARVELKTIPTHDIKPPISPVGTATEGAHRYFLQAGAFSQLSYAERLQIRLSSLTDQPIHIEKSPSTALYRVRVGPINDERIVNQLTARFIKEGIKPKLITE